MAQSNQIVLTGELGKKRISRKNVESVFTATPWKAFWVYLGLALVSVIPFVLPFALVAKERWDCNHTRIVGMTLRFEGRGGQLLGKFFLWGLIFIVTASLGVFGIAGAYKRWVVEHTIFGPEA